MHDFDQRAIDAHRRYGGKIGMHSTMPIANQDELSMAYTPGVAAVSRAIAADPGEVRELTGKGNTVAVVSDGSAVLGLGNVGPEAALPVMEGKAALFKAFAGVDAFPIVLDTQDPDDIVRTVRAMAPGFGGINLEDIAAPQCFDIESRLKNELDIPVFHDDQHGTAIVVLAGLMNALRVVGKQAQDVRVVISGAGAAGIATARILAAWGVGGITVTDSKGTIRSEREDLSEHKRNLLELSAYQACGQTLAEAVVDADVYIGVSQPSVLDVEAVATMREGAIVFALSNPNPEILPEQAQQGGAAVVATGRSDYPNQVNNVLAFPGIFRGLLDVRAANVTDTMNIAAAEGVAATISSPTSERILPDVFTDGLAATVAGAVRHLT